MECTTKEKRGKSSEIPNKVKIIRLLPNGILPLNPAALPLDTNIYSPDHITHCPLYQSSVRFEGGYFLLQVTNALRRGYVYLRF